MPQNYLKLCPLQGQHVILEPYQEANRDEVRATLNCDPEAWNLFSMSGQGSHFDGWWSRIMAATGIGEWMAYAIRARDSGRVVGTSSFLNIRPDRNTVEIGATFLHPSVRATRINPEAKLLMLRHAFAAATRRVELVTDGRNLRSQAAIAKLGAVREGVLRRDRTTWTGYIRDTVMYSILAEEWPAVERGLLARLSPT